MLNIAKVKTGSFVDGPDGPRTVVWFSGCSIRCLDCQNTEIWPADSGIPFPPRAIAAQVVGGSNGQPITITGGEPFDQVQELYEFLSEIRRLAYDRHVIIYTGNTIEQLMERWRESWGSTGRPEDQNITSILHMVEVLVDGPYQPILDNDHMQWRGSSNQRVISLPRSIVAGMTTLDLEERPDAIVLLDWDTPVVEIHDGRITATGGLGDELHLIDLGAIEEIARCGEAQLGDILGFSGETHA